MTYFLFKKFYCSPTLAHDSCFALASLHVTNSEKIRLVLQPNSVQVPV